MSKVVLQERANEASRLCLFQLLDARQIVQAGEMEQFKKSPSGSPVRSSTPAASTDSIRFRRRNCRTMAAESTPRTESTVCTAMGWRYAMIESTSIAATESRTSRLCPRKRRAMGANSGRNAN
jgi:hypothetical protein